MKTKGTEVDSAYMESAWTGHDEEMMQNGRGSQRRSRDERVLANVHEIGGSGLLNLLTILLAGKAPLQVVLEAGLRVYPQVEHQHERGGSMSAYDTQAALATRRNKAYTPPTMTSHITRALKTLPDDALRLVVEQQCAVLRTLVPDATITLQRLPSRPTTRTLEGVAIVARVRSHRFASVRDLLLRTYAPFATGIWTQRTARFLISDHPGSLELRLCMARSGLSPRGVCH